MARAVAEWVVWTQIGLLLVAAVLGFSAATTSAAQLDSTLTPTPFGGGHGQIAFVSNRDKFDDIYVMDTDGSHVQRITNSSDSDWSPSWSPDGKQIAFSSQRGAWHIYTMNANGSTQQQLTLPDNLFWAPAQFDTFPDWSPDGEFVLFQSNRHDGENIYVINVKKGTIRQLTFGFERKLTPAWSPNQRYFAYPVLQNSTSDLVMDIYVQALDPTAAPFNLTNHPAWYGSPDWSPDGKQIIFASDRDGNSEIYIVNVDGSNLRRITNDPADDMDPTWSPDGSQIAFVSERGDNTDIYVMDASGGSLQRLTYDPAVDRAPAWRL
ncbi:MAG: PD40 domain-containing protein [Anaerolineae bacterium]|nr:PD40 domain-containing protein [Anaerolineae bacterium]